MIGYKPYINLLVWWQIHGLENYEKSDGHVIHPCRAVDRKQYLPGLSCSYKNKVVTIKKNF